jgi:DNA-binding MarR family transcriptional regulator
VPARPRVTATEQHVLDALAAGVPTPLGDLCRQAHQTLATYLEEQLKAKGWSGLRAAHVSLLATIEPEGSRLTTLAARGGRTKQTAAQLVTHLLRHDLVQLQPDPVDRRAKIYVPTRRALQLLADSERIVEHYRGWLETTLGSRATAQLRRSLTIIVEQRPETEPG